MWLLTCPMSLTPRPQSHRLAVGVRQRQGGVLVQHQHVHVPHRPGQLPLSPRGGGGGDQDLALRLRLRQGAGEARAQGLAGGVEVVLLVVVAARRRGVCPVGEDEGGVRVDVLGLLCNVWQFGQ